MTTIETWKVSYIVVGQVQSSQHLLVLAQIIRYAAYLCPGQGSVEKQLFI